MIDYSWVPWFEELASKIATGSPDDLVESARRVNWRTKEVPGILKYGIDKVDPFSFIYTLASHRNDEDFMARLHSAHEVFLIKTPCLAKRPHIIWGLSARSALFHNSDGRDNPSLLWRLFKEAVLNPKDHAAIGSLFDSAKDIPNVGLFKLTRGLFIINPRVFYPADDRSGRALGLASSRLQSADVPKDYSEYHALLDDLRARFPGCEPYEISTFLDNVVPPRSSPTQAPLLADAPTFFHVSTNVHDDGNDHWAEFGDRNAVWTGVPGPPAGGAYPLRECKRGDVILVRHGVGSGRGIAVVEENGYSGGWDREKHVSVYWINKNAMQLHGQTGQHGFGRAPRESETYQAFRRTSGYSQTLDAIDRLAEGEVGQETERERTARRGDDTETCLNQILCGPPGTSKTYDAVSLAVKVIDGKLAALGEDRATTKQRFDELMGSKQVGFVTFHQNYAYEDFVEGIRPVLDAGSLRYWLRDGVFKQIARRANADADNRYVLIIDEINRGNIAKIFGELITLIEPSKRLGEEDELQVTLPYSQEPFGVPPNLYLIGTMNTADRGIALLDVALRRRFEFDERMPDVGMVAWKFESVNGGELLQAINDRIIENLDREHQIGHTYLMKVDSLDALARVFQTQIIPLLQEYFYDDWEKMRRVLNDSAFITKREAGERVVFDVLPPDHEAWRQAESYRAIYGSSGSPTDG